MNVLLFDPEQEGHHIQYINCLGGYCASEGDEVWYVTWSPLEDPARLQIESSDFHVRYVREKGDRKWRRGRFTKLLDLYKALKKGFAVSDEAHADIFHIMSIDRLEIVYFLYFLFRRKKNVRISATLISPYFEHKAPQGNFLTRNLRLICYRIVKMFLKRMLSSGRLSALFVLSEETRRMLTDTWGTAYNDRIIAVPDPVTPFEKGHTQEEARTILDLPVQGIQLLFFGRLRKFKGPDILLQALSRVQSSEKITCVIAGKPGEISKETIETLARNTPGNIQVIQRLEFIPDDLMEDYYISSDAVVLPYTKEYDGTSGILQHAAAAGKPVIGTDAGQIGGIIREWGLGVAVPPGSPDGLAEAIDAFINTVNEKDIQTYRENAARYADKHSWKIMTRTIRDTFLEKGNHGC